MKKLEREFADFVHGGTSTGQSGNNPCPPLPVCPPEVYVPPQPHQPQPVEPPPRAELA